MAVVALSKFNNFSKSVAHGKHNLGSDSLKIVLSLTAPLATAQTLSDITQIASGNGYTSGGNRAIAETSDQTDGIYKLTLNNPNPWIAVTGSMASFRYAVMYNATATAKDLICYWDYGSAITLTVGQVFSTAFDETNGVLTIT